VGELAFFWRRFAAGELCSCTKPLPDCPFWSVVIDKAFGHMTREQARDLNRLERRLVRRQWMLELAPAHWSTRWSHSTRLLLRERARLYRSICEVSNAGCIVDSGKEVVFGATVARLARTDFSTIHLVRDPRGVAFSWRKQVKSDSEPGDMPRSPAVQTAVRWMSSNLLIQASLRRLSSAYVRVRYEDLVAHPHDSVRKISAAASFPLAAGMQASQLAQGKNEYHLVGSNPGVRSSLGSELQLKLDEEWKTQLPRMQRLLVTAICGRLMAVYGYPRH
jgi:Sulfotransferase family